MQVLNESIAMTRRTAVVVGVGVELGLGAALCRRFGAEGLHVLVAGRTPSKLDDPHFRSRGIVMTDARGWDHIGTPIRFENEPGRVRFDPPALGQHSQAILRALGYAEGEIAQLTEQGAIKGATPEEISLHAADETVQLKGSG